MDINQAPFTIENQFYRFTSLSLPHQAEVGVYHVLFVYSGSCLYDDGSHKISLCSGDYLAFLSSRPIHITDIQSDSNIVLLSKPVTKTYTEILPERSSSLHQDAYKVTKPWGFEYWITGPFPQHNSVLKFISILSGFRTSLQVHLEKHESNYLVSGEATFNYSLETYSTSASSYAINSIHIDRPLCINVPPRTVHQLEALSDISLIEASTNHLDDVIRLQDDTGRSHGRIESEHSSL